MRAFSMPEPYRLLFPLGIAYALLAALLWPLHGAGWIAYPATLHWTLMIQGFLHSFVIGFLLTAMPAFLHGDKAKPWETAVAVMAMLTFGAAAVAGWTIAAQAAYLVTILLVVLAGVRRLPHRRGDPAEEFVLVALGFAFALAGATASIGIGAGWWEDRAPRFTLHLFTEGMMLSVVLGVGALLVPTFSGMTRPMAIPFLAKPGERRPRRALYALVIALLIAAMVFEGAGHAALGARIRLIPTVTMLLLVWKLFRVPQRRDLFSMSLWIAGWFVLAGVSIAALFPTRSILGFHFMFLGGFGFLILGIATRVIVSHGGYGLGSEGQILCWDTVAGIGLALVARVTADLLPSHANVFYGLSGLFWVAAWSAWGIRALPKLLTRQRPLSRPAGPEIQISPSSPSPGAASPSSDPTDRASGRTADRLEWHPGQSRSQRAPQSRIPLRPRDRAT